MKLENVLFPRPDKCRLVVSADAAELQQAADAELAAKPALTGDDLWNNAVNRALLTGISPLYQQAVKAHNLTPLQDPSFELLAFDRAQGFTAAAEFCLLPALELGRYTGFTQPIEPKPVQEYAILMEINMHQQAAYDAADEAGKAAMRQEAAARLYEKNCSAAQVLAERQLVLQLGEQVTGFLPKELLNKAHFEEMHRFFLRMEANKLNFDLYLKGMHQTKEAWEVWMHQMSEQKLRTELGLLLIAQRENLYPTVDEVTAELHHWNAAKYQKPTFLANDIRRIRQRLASDNARAFVLAHSTLTPPPAEPVIRKAQL